MLLTPQEVISYTTLPKEFPSFDFRRIKALEYEFFSNSKFLGIPLYQRMIEAKNSLEIEEWNSEVTYAIEDSVKREGVAYVAKEVNTNKRPPNNSWGLQEKFNDECFNKIWCDGFLGELLAYKILLARIPLIANDIHKEGIGTSSDKLQKATLEEYKITYNGVQSIHNTLSTNFEHFMKSSENCLNLPNLETNCTCNACNGCGGCVNKKDNFDTYLVA